MTIDTKTITWKVISTDICGYFVVYCQKTSQSVYAALLTRRASNIPCMMRANKSARIAIPTSPTTLSDLSFSIAAAATCPVELDTTVKGHWSPRVQPGIGI